MFTIIITIINLENMTELGMNNSLKTGCVSLFSHIQYIHYRSKVLDRFLKEVSSAHQGCNYLIKNK